MSAEDEQEAITDPDRRYTRANLMPSTEFNKKVYRAYDDETAVEVAWVEYNNVPTSIDFYFILCIFLILLLKLLEKHKKSEFVWFFFLLYKTFEY